MTTMHARRPLVVPAGLDAVYALYAARHGAPGLRLRDFPGRWLALPREQACSPRVLPVADMEPAGHPVTGFTAFRRAALAHAVPGSELVFVCLRRDSWNRLDDSPLAPPTQMLAIRVEISGHAVGLAGQVDLDDQGCPCRTYRPFALVVNPWLL